jgi:hypothetical protein
VGTRFGSHLGTKDFWGWGGWLGRKKDYERTRNEGAKTREEARPINYLMREKGRRASAEGGGREGEYLPKVR